MMQLVEENLYNKTLDDKIATKFCSSLFRKKACLLFRYL